MKSSTEISVLASGAYCHHAGEWKSTSEFNSCGYSVFADLHRSLLSRDSPEFYCLVGFLQEEHLNFAPLSIGSKGSWFSIATPEPITGIEKNHWNSVSVNVSGVQVASDGHNVYY
ncbi:unnamed protein product [Schistosoma curassoni]|uniref:MIR domain-containing protein n=1 Tax=Schistosoma curassoni TaxID=6186 RepID=A0A183KP27_9TREM|nr:unnamed protein product [Schistosoma curassoni]